MIRYIVRKFKHLCYWLAYRDELDELDEKAFRHHGLVTNQDGNYVCHKCGADCGTCHVAGWRVFYDRHRADAAEEYKLLVKDLYE